MRWSVCHVSQIILHFSQYIPLIQSLLSCPQEFLCTPLPPYLAISEADRRRVGIVMHAVLSRLVAAEKMMH